MSSIFYTPESLHRHYPTRKKLVKFKKRWMAQKGFRFTFYIVDFKHIDFASGVDRTVDMILFKRPQAH